MTASPQDSTEEQTPAIDERVDTSWSIETASGPLDYQASAGRLVLREESGKARASIFHVYYRTSDEPDPERPITFCFNGGPGSSSVWLHLGAFGPRRIDMGEDGFDLEPPYALSDNAHTLLDVTDLVFIDPVTTGYSRAAKDVDDSKFHGQREDVESVAEFIRLFLTREQRWNSPIYLSGESYGTTRAAALAEHLENRHGIYPSGLVLVSSILDFQTARFDEGNDLPFALFLPTYTATAWFHGKLPPATQGLELKAVVQRAREFAGSEYLLALFQGDMLTDERRAAVTDELQALTGLSPEYLDATNLRVRIDRFCKELRRSEGITVGRLDSRYTANDRDSASDGYEFDPSYAAIQGPYTMSLNGYLRGELGYESDLPYEILTGRVQPWNYENVQNEYLNVAEDLRKAMARNKALRVYVANGYYDLATPFFATEYTFDHLGLPAGERGRIAMGYFEAGHMMYVKRSELELLHNDLQAFYAAR